MRNPIKIAFFFSLALLFIGVKSSFKSPQTKDSAKIEIVSFHSYSIQDYSESPQHKIIAIRHRSPHEIKEIVVPTPTEKLLFSCNSLESTPEYFSKWITYFHFEAVSLPDDQAFPTATSLRAPPFSC
jgi:hypothetical protein